MLIAIIQNKTIINVANGDIDEDGWILRMIWPTATYVYLDTLPEGAWLGWYQDENGNWIDPDPFQPGLMAGLRK